MANRQVNDVWLDKLLPVLDSEAGLLEVDASGSSSVSATITTQVGTSTPSQITAKLQGSNDGATWFDLAGTTTTENVAAIGVKTVTGSIQGYAWVRVRFKRHVTGTDTWLITAAINTGL